MRDLHRCTLNLRSYGSFHSAEVANTIIPNCLSPEVKSVQAYDIFICS